MIPFTPFPSNVPEPLRVWVRLPPTCWLPLKFRNPAVVEPAAKLQYPLLIKLPPMLIVTKVVPPAAVVYGKNLPPAFTVMFPKTVMALDVAFHCKLPVTSKEAMLVT